MEEKTIQQPNTHQKTIYDSGYGEIFLKHFLAGLGHALGALFVNLILFIVTGYLFVVYVLPQFTPLINSMTNLSKSLAPFTNTKTAPGFTLRNLLGQ